MATILDKELTRESTAKIDGREILITLTPEQEISFKLKGLKTNGPSIGIEALYIKLTGDDKEPEKTKDVVKRKKSDSDPMINLYDLRTNNLVTKMDFKVKMELEKLICELIRQNIKIFDSE
jgi:hypothetical protein